MAWSTGHRLVAVASLASPADAQPDPVDAVAPAEAAVGERPEDGQRPTRRQLGWRWAARGIALVAVAITVMLIALGIGMRSNDSAISEHLGTATATVLSVSPLSTGIEFVDVAGTTIRPEGGVLYPGLLTLGQQFVVEYSTQDPQIARVAGRTAAVGNLQLGLTAAVTFIIAVPLIWWCLRRSRLPLFGRRPGPGHAAAPRTPTSP